jgi:hypothetical protein
MIIVWEKGEHPPPVKQRVDEANVRANATEPVEQGESRHTMFDINRPSLTNDRGTDKINIEQRAKKGTRLRKIGADWCVCARRIPPSLAGTTEQKRRERVEYDLWIDSEIQEMYERESHFNLPKLHLLMLQYSLDGLRKTIPAALDSVSTASINRYYYHCLRIMSAYRNGLGYGTREFTEKVYKLKVIVRLLTRVNGAYLPRAGNSWFPLFFLRPHIT